MSTYTAADLAEIRRALRELAMGERVTQITQNGRTVMFAQTSMNQLERLERQVAAEVERTTNGPRSRTRQTITSKGL